MEGLRGRTGEGELHSHAHGGGDGVAVPHAGGLHDDARPSRRTRSFQCRHRHFSFQRHRIQPTRKHIPLPTV